MKLVQERMRREELETASMLNFLRTFLNREKKCTAYGDKYEVKKKIK